MMGYIYDRSGRLACDRCGVAGGVRKRTCPHRVRYAEGGSLPYCSPAALCDPCYQAVRGDLHKRCKAGAEARNLAELERGRRLAAGDYESRTGWGDWCPTVPKGMVGRRFVAANGAELYYLVPRAIDDARPGRRGGADWLSDVLAMAEAAGTPLVPWTDPDRPSGSKEVVLPATLPTIRRLAPAPADLFGELP